MSFSKIEPILSWTESLKIHYYATENLYDSILSTAFNFISQTGSEIRNRIGKPPNKARVVDF